jgi:hypothetical protein
MSQNKKHFLLLLGAINIDQHRGNTEPGGVIEKYTQWVRSINQAGKLVQAEKLVDGIGYRVLNQKNQIIDGPFTETKETISSFFMITAENYEEAVKIARECPAVVDQGGYVEVREISSCPLNG